MSSRSYPGWVRVVVAVLGGLLLVASFPPYDLVWLAPVGLALLTLAWHGARVRAGLGLGFLAGLAFFLVHVQWIRVVGDDAWVILAAYCALWIALVGAGVALTSRLRWWPLVVPLLWVAEEALRDRVPLGGFPWGRLAYGQTDTILTPYAAVAGAPAVTFAVALIGALLAWAVLCVRDRRPRPVVLALVATAVTATAGGLVPLPVQGETTDGPADVTAAVVQGGVEHIGMGTGDTPGAVLAGHVRATEQLVADVAAGRSPQPDLVVWPESSTDLDPFADPRAYASIQQAVDAIGVPVLVGATVDDPANPAEVRNVGIVWGPTDSVDPGPGEYYVKQHPVPFGEWVPWRSVLDRFISRFALIPKDFAAGDATGVMQVGPAVVGDVICFEVAYDDLMRDATTGAGVRGELAGQGGRLLTVQTNNATYALTGQPEQQVAMSQLRAVEHGRTVLVAATSGISAIVAPDGTIVGSLPELRPGVLVATVPLRDTLTLADRLGAAPEWAATALAVFALGVAAAAGFRRRDAVPVRSDQNLVPQEPVP